MGGLRERKRMRQMRRVQECAVALFTRHGFDAVSVERIAEGAEVSPVSVYRWFGTKEGLVLWDDYDPPLLERVAEFLASHPPLLAVRDAVIAELEHVYNADRALVLTRAKLIVREPAIAAANRNSLAAFEAALAEVFAGAAGAGDDFGCQVDAAVAVALLAAAVTRWQAHDGEVPLGVLVEAAFARAGVAR